MSYIANKAYSNISNIIFEHDTSITTATVVSSTVAEIPGTEITYAPPSDSKKIIYEVVLQTFFNPDSHNRGSYELFEDGTPMGTYYRTVESTHYLKYQNVTRIRFLIPAYTGSKTFKLRVRSYSNSYEFRLTNDGTTNFTPITHMYSII